MSAWIMLFAAAAAVPDTLLATFDGAKGTSYRWSDMNDPVMGGASTSSFREDKTHKTGIFNGTCAIVKFLNAPGFAKITTANWFAKFKDISAHIGGGMQLRVRSTTPTYTGYRLGFAAKGVPRTSPYGGGSFKGNFALKNTTDWQVASVPFNAFSYDWSGYTGRCDTKDPGGQQHHCCTPTSPKYCPTAEYLATVTDLEIWAEGVAGDFHLEVEWIGASSAL